MSGYTLSAPGNSSASTKGFVAEELSPIQSPGAATQFENSGLAVLGAIGGILTNFVGAMYIKMFSEIIQAVTKSHASLVATSHLHLANVLVANIRTDELREKTLSDLALALKLPPAP
jgi:hypothetical protein